MLWAFYCNTFSSTAPLPYSVWYLISEINQQEHSRSDRTRDGVGTEETVREICWWGWSQSQSGKLWGSQVVNMTLNLVGNKLKLSCQSGDQNNYQASHPKLQGLKENTRKPMQRRRGELFAMHFHTGHLTAKLYDIYLGFTSSGAIHQHSIRQTNLSTRTDCMC